MEIPEFVETLDQEGRSLAAAAEQAGPDAKVATCPGWQVRDLVRHTGMVHRWATAFVAEGYAAYHPDGGLPSWTPPNCWPGSGTATAAWSTRSRPLRPTWPAGAFLPAPSPLAFWARRQAHETTVHRVDAQSALGETPGTVTRAFAVDGIDELLRGFHGRPRSEVRTPTPRVLRVRATDVDAVWTVRLSPEPPVSEWGAGAGGDVDCEMAGPAAGLYLALWNRLPFPDMTGDASLAALWREKSGITWG
nr:maleylpyruvate isomerase family mycothiol-dependent enzyme [Streptomyces sp. RLB1-33]